MKTPTKVECETCRFWVVGDVSRKKIGNVGQCTWTLPRTADFYARTVHAPYWLEKITHQTTGWEGTNCGTWTKR